MVFCALLLALSTIPASRPAHAQGGDIRDLIESLQSLEQLGGGRRGSPITRRPPTDLDRARTGGAGQGAARFRLEERTLKVPGERPGRRGFAEAELVAIQRFCRGETDPEIEDRLIMLDRFSPLERDYCRRAGEVLFQFGYDFLAGEVTPETLMNGAVSEDYILGIGDQLIITFFGQESATHTVFVDREGRVVLTNMAPIPAAGRRFGDFRRELEARTETAFLGTDVFVSVGSVRSISVAVLGEVEKPGLHRLTGLSTVLDAIGLAGGVRKTGSLRRIRIQRGGDIFWLDLYELLMTGMIARDLGIFEGDRIFVPPLGPTVAVAGRVKRPGIYELAEGQGSVTLDDLLTFAGGTLRPRGNSYYHVTFAEDGKEQITEAPDGGAGVSDGDIIIVRPREDVQLGSVELVGRVRTPGRRSLRSAPTIRALVRSQDSLGEDPYLLLAALETTDPATRARRLFPVNLQAVLANQSDFSLRDDDRLIVLGADDVRYLSSRDVQDVIFGQSKRKSAQVERSIAALRAQVQREGMAGKEGGALDPAQAQKLVSQVVPQPERPEFSCAGLDALAVIVGGGERSRFSNAIRASFAESDEEFAIRPVCPPLFDEFADLLPFLLEHAAAVNGEVRRPGAYPITRNTTLASLISVAGGLTREVDLAQVELTQYVAETQGGLAAAPFSRATVDLRAEGVLQTAINPGDVVRVNRVFTGRESGPIELIGEFRRPGVYHIRRGERMSELTARAGGLTELAYPFGAVFTRERVKKAQQAGFDRASRELISTLAVLAAQKGVDPRGVLVLQDLSRQLQEVEALGRVVIEADPTVLQVRPELDTVLEPGDKLFMPKRPNFVSVTGDVLNPGALQFASGNTADAYINRAGGYQRSADQDRVFVVYPNGEAQPLALSVWNYTPVQIPPGSAIVIPKEPAPLDLLQFAKDMTSLVSQLAITAASLTVIGNN